MRSHGGERRGGARDGNPVAGVKVVEDVELLDVPAGDNLVDDARGARLGALGPDTLLERDQLGRRELADVE